MPNRDEVGGKIDKAVGIVKEHVGRATGDAELESEGAAERATGEVRSKFGEGKRKVGKFIKDVGDKVKKS